MKNGSCNRKSASFSLIELLTVIGILIVLVGILVPVLQRSRDRAAQVTCINNIRQLSLAMQMYYNKNRVYPRGDLSEDLAEFLADSDNGSFVCPISLDTYDNYYVARDHGADDDAYFIGCPTHHTVNFAPGRGTQTFAHSRVLHNGAACPVGGEVSGGLLEFEDGSKVSLSGMAKVLASFRTGDGTLYTILRLFGRYGMSIIDVDVTPGSRFEIVTPAAIAGVAGTSFNLRSHYNPGQDIYTTDVMVSSGLVDVMGREEEEATGPGRSRLAPGQSVSVRVRSAKAQKDPKPPRDR